MSRPALWAAAVALAGLPGCLSADLVDASEPKQTEKVNPLSADGAHDFEQRKKDCWDMPNAAACYEIGMSYELGANAPRDKTQAHDYYAKACEISDDPEHCEAADRVKP